MVTISDMTRLEHHVSIDFWIDHLAFTDKDATQNLQFCAGIAPANRSLEIIAGTIRPKLAEFTVPGSR